MKSKLAALLLASATLGGGPLIFAPPMAAQAEVEVSFEFFQDSLSPYGEWIEVGDYGLCWRPTDVGENWAPYTDGYWSYTDAGWTWVSYEEFGAVAYHYGRWVNVEDEGWCWVPDYEWGPAWVSWRNNDEYVGWAPLPPEAAWEPDRGFSVWVDSSYDIGPSNYNFCAVGDFGAPVISEVIIERPRNIFFIENTVNITNISINRGLGIPFCGGPRFDFIRDRVRRPIPTLKLVRETNITNIYNNTYINKTVNKTVVRGGRGRGSIRNAVAGNQLIVAAPRVKRLKDQPEVIAELKPQRKVGREKVNRGWKNVADDNQRRELKEKLVKQTEGKRPENARAKPVEAAELTPVPTKGDPNAPSPVAGRDRGNGRKGGKNRADAPIAATPAEPGRDVPEAGKPARGDRPGQADRNGKKGGKNRDEAPIVATPAAPAPEVAGTDKPDREDRPGRPDREDKKARRDDERPGGMAGRENLKPFNGGRDEAKEKQGKKTDVAPAPEAPKPLVTEVPEADRPAKRDDAERPKAARDAAREERQEKAKRASEEAQRQAATNRIQREEAEAQQRSRKQREREVEAAQPKVRQPDDSAVMERQREAAANRRQEAAQQEGAQREIQQQRRQRQQMEAAQAAQAAQRQQAVRQQQIERQQQQVQRQRQQPVEQQRPPQVDRQQQIQRQMQRQQQQQQMQRPQPRVQQQQPPVRQGGGGGGGGGGRGRNLTPEEAAALRKNR